MTLPTTPSDGCQHSHFPEVATEALNEKAFVQGHLVEKGSTNISLQIIDIRAYSLPQTSPGNYWHLESWEGAILRRAEWGQVPSQQTASSGTGGS